MTPEVRNKILVFVGSVVAGILFLMPTFFPKQFAEKGSWVSRPISLGLDLSGGVHLVYEVLADQAVESRLQSIANGVRAELRKEKIAVLRAVANDKGQIEVTLASTRRVEDAKEMVIRAARELEFLGQESDGQRVKLRYGTTEQYRQRIKREAVSQAVETLRNRVDQFGVTEPLIQQVGQGRIMLQMPGVSDIEAVKRIVGRTAKLEFRLLPGGASGGGTITVKDKSGAPVRVEDQVLMGGDAVESARMAIESGQVEVILNLNSQGAREFRRITTEYVGRNLAIILDGVLYSAPTIREPITGGVASISGGFTVEEARELAVVLKAGALPAPLQIEEERTVGPTLGAESIRRGVLAISFGFFAVAVFMVVYYRKAGALAVGSLLFNAFFLLALLSAFGATLTLPGLAGLALTIGMAVDSNIIIYERIRDELRNGASRDVAVRLGFDKAFSAIIDSNLTTLVSAMILYFLGSGPIRGFAVTLALGIATTLYCAVFVAKLGFQVFSLRGSRDPISI